MRGFINIHGRVKRETSDGIDAAQIELDISELDAGNTRRLGRGEAKGFHGSGSDC